MTYYWFEFSLVILSLGITLLVGMYFSKDGRSSLKEYMLGGRKMTVIPTSLSIAATYLTGSSVIASCEEVYKYGMQTSLVVLAYGLNGIWFTWVYLPVSYSVKSASSFEFFGRRFNNRVRKFASAVYTFETLQHTAISQMVPALALAQATALPIFPIACALSLICYVYTASGGLKAVTWADGVQATIFMSCIVFLFFAGVVTVGGPVEVWRRTVEGSRWEFFNFDPSPDVRYNILNLTIGSLLLTPNLYLSPSFHQRVVAMPTFQQARQVAIWSSIFAAVFFFFSYNMGLVVYAFFAGCDPVLAGKGIQSYQAILPYFVDQISSKFPGVLALFLSGVIAAGLSTTTSCWNTVACTVYEDLIKPLLKPNVPKKTAFKILNGIVLAVAVISTAMIPLLQNMRSIIEITLALKSLSTSFFFVLYNAGLFLPWVNSTGALVGSLFSSIITVYVTMGSQRAKSQHLVMDFPKILTTAQCIVNGTTMEVWNLTTSIGTEGFGLQTKSDPSIPWLHKLSLMYYMLPGTSVGLLVAYLASALTGMQDLATVDREMIVPQMRWVLPPTSTKAAVETQLDDEKEDEASTKEYKMVPQIELVD